MTFKLTLKLTRPHHHRNQWNSTGKPSISQKCFQNHWKNHLNHLNHPFWNYCELINSIINYQLIRNSLENHGLNGLNGFAIGFISILTNCMVFLRQSLICNRRMPEGSLRSDSGRRLLEATGIWKHLFWTVILPAQNWFFFKRILKEKYWFWPVPPPVEN